MKNKKPFIIKYDKHTPNGKGGMCVSRTVVQADTKDIAVRRMKSDVYRYGINNAIVSAKMPNGKVIDFKVRKNPKIDTVEFFEKSKIISRQVLQGSTSNFGKFE